MNGCMLDEEENVLREAVYEESLTRIYERTTRRSYIDCAEFTHGIVNSNV